MDESNTHTEKLIKIAGAVFAAVVAPIVTGIAVNLIQKKIDDPKPDAAAPVAKVATTAEGPSASAPAKEKADAGPGGGAAAQTKPKDLPKPVAKTELATAPKPSANRPFPKKKAQVAERLFNGRDLTGFDTYLGAPQNGKSAYGLNNDPEKVFTVHGGHLHISGKVLGGLVTESSYENYHLTLEYKWGEKKWLPRANLPRLGGIVLHASGAPGDVFGWSMAGVTCHIGEFETGSLAVPDALAKPISFTASAERVALKKAGRFEYVFKPGEPLTTLQSGAVHGLDFHPPLAKKAPGAKSSRVQVNPVGEWNKLECICVGDRITIVLNGTVVNVATRVSHTRGKIFIQSRAAEISFRTIELKPQFR
jgi:hypothetical protein